MFFKLAPPIKRGFIVITMDEATKRYITIIALDILINQCNNMLEDVELNKTMDPQEKQFTIELKELSLIYKKELEDSNHISKPQWQK